MIRTLFHQIAALNADPSDDDDLRLRKSMLAVSMIPFFLAGFVWGTMYYFLNEPMPAVIPWSYCVVLAASFVHYIYSKKFEFFCKTQLLLILLLPVALMASLGGYRNGSAVILWSLFCPLGAMLFDELKNSVRWVIAFAALALVSMFVQPWLRETNNLSADALVILSALNITVPGSLVLYMVFFFVKQKNVYQERSESLLLNILPPEIVAELKTNRESISCEYPEASILFADMVGFTTMAKQMQPVAVVKLLNEVFSAFDEMVEQHNLEKIKTIGDSYMVAAGIPRECDEHAVVITSLALEMREYIEKTTFGGGRKVSFRFGINSGPVLAGVIGTKKFAYDVWGDTVNVASRMESHGEAGVIQVTRDTYELIKDEFVCEARGMVDVKGKGEIETWMVNGERRRENGE